MMNCDQFLESIDAYVDGELAVEDLGAADAHRRQCLSCSRAVAARLATRQSLKRLASTVPLPTALEQRVLQSVTPWWRQLETPWFTARRAVGLAAVATVCAMLLALAGPSVLDARTANALDRLAVNVDESSAVVIKGTLLCRDCELTHRYGIESSCQRIGHHGAIFLDDGVVLNLVEQRSSSRLVHDDSLFGKQVVVRGRLLRSARTLSVDSFQIQG